MLKRLDSRYAPGKRSGAWLKVKNVGRQEFVIGGWLPGEGRRREPASARSCSATHDADGELRYAGKVGTGFSERDLEELGERLAAARARARVPSSRTGPSAQRATSSSRSWSPRSSSAS